MSERRRALGLTQTDLAVASRLSRPLISAVETGRHVPSVRAALAIAAVLGSTVEEVRIEYVIRPGWSLETSSDTLGRSGIDVFWKRRY